MSLSSLIRRVIVALAALLLFGCTTNPSVPETILNTEGFKPFPSARAFNLPGTIYRVDPSDQIFVVDALEGGIDPKIGDEVIPKLISKSSFSVELLLNTIGATADLFPANVRSTLSRQNEVTIECVSGFRRYLTDYQVDNNVPSVLARNKIRSDNKYYLIRETVATKNLTYSAKKNWITDAGIEAQFKKVIDTKAKLNWSSGDEFSMDKDFDKPMDIWYKAERLNITIPDGAAPGQFKIEVVPAAKEEITLSGTELKQP